MSSSAGPKPNSSVGQAAALWIGTALISTPCSIRNVSSPGSTNAGSVVVKEVAGRGSRQRQQRAQPARRRAAALAAALPGGGQVTGRLEAALDARALAVDRLHVALGDLLLEDGVRHR